MKNISFLFKRSVFLVLFLPMVLIAEPITTIGGVAIASMTVKSVIDKASKKLDKLIAQLEASGINVTTNATEQVNISLENFKNITAGQLDKTVGSLSKERQAVAYSLAKSIHDTDTISQNYLEFGNMSLLSFEKTIDDSLLGAFSKNSIIVQKVLGRAQLQNPSMAYRIGIIATNIGTGESDMSNSFSLYINNEKINFKSEGTDRHKRVFIIANKTLKKYFQNKEIANAVMKLKVKQNYESWLSWITPWFDKEIAHDIVINLALYPKWAGTLQVKYEIPTHKWQYQNIISKTSIGACHNCSAGSPFALVLSVTGGDLGSSTTLNSERLMEVSCRCVSGGCWFDENGAAGAHTLNISAHKDSASCNGHHRTQPTKWILSARREKYIYGNPNKYQNNQEFFFNNTAEIRVPKNAVAIRLIGKLSTGEVVNVGLDPLKDLNGIVNISGDDSNGIDRIFHIEVKPKQPDIGI